MLSNSKPKIIFIVGCTASGKGTVGRALAEKMNADILSVDSMKVYKYMDIGTAKPDIEIRSRIPHHLIDVTDPSEPFSAGRFVDLAQQAINQRNIPKRHDREGVQELPQNRPIIAIGGTVLYLKALTEGLFEGPAANPAVRQQLQQKADQLGQDYLHQELYRIDPETADRLHRNDLKRIIRALEVYHLTGKPISSLQKQFGQLRTDYDMLFLGLRQEKEELNRRIAERVRRMVRRGLVEEVRTLYERTPPMSPQARDAVGYAEIIEHFKEKWDLPVALEKVKVNTRRLAKMQRTWFRRLPHIHWFDIEPQTDPEKTIKLVEEKIEPWLADP
ncbi:MAG: tRNA (adenosine(37)-N6)-dimethylallyltransferase MiaA [Phycisphaerae bacterium]